MISQTAALEYMNSINSGRYSSIKEDIKKSGQLVQTINEKTGHLKGIAKKQTILSLNATIEAARSGEAGVGFAVVAKSMQDLSNQSAGIYTDIETSVEEITNLINSIIEAFE
jgi:methyl-accepting chemotaxis protein